MLKPMAFANAFAATVGVFGVVMWLLSTIAPSLFNMVYNAQFLGADAATTIPPSPDLATMLVSIVVMVITGWVMGYLVAYFYNMFGGYSK